MEMIVKVDGMMCPHCEAHCKAALEALPQVDAAVCDHTAKTATLTLNAPVDMEAVKAAVAGAGYQVID